MLPGFGAVAHASFGYNLARWDGAGFYPGGSSNPVCLSFHRRNGFERNYLVQDQPRPVRQPHPKTIAMAVGALCSLAAVTAFGVAPLSAPDLPPSQRLIEPLALQPHLFENNEPFAQQERIRRGETLGSLMSRLGSQDESFAAFVRKDPLARRLLELRPGRTVSASVGEGGAIHRLTYRLVAADDKGLGVRLVIRRGGSGWSATEEPVPVERSVETRSAEVRTTLAAALDASEIPDNVVTRMADIFGSAVDLGRDVRRGDRLRVVYETLREAGSLDEPIVGRIQAVEFRSGARKLDAVWFEGPGGGEYFTFDGKSLAKPFLASPVEFNRVTSGFTGERFHPVTRDWRAHNGVDFPASLGSTVRSTAAGTIEFIGQQRGYGNVIVIRHDKHLTTLYAHLHEFADGLQHGAQVGQGTPIGTVGMTGWATGPHLHFEFHIDGQHVDPMLAVMPAQVRVLAGDERGRFGALAGQHRARFGMLDTQLAANFE